MNCLLALKIDGYVLFGKLTLVFIVMFCLVLGLQSDKLKKNLNIYLTKLKVISHPLKYSFAPPRGASTPVLRKLGLVDYLFLDCQPDSCMV